MRSGVRISFDAIFSNMLQHQSMFRMLALTVLRPPPPPPRAFEIQRYKVQLRGEILSGAKSDGVLLTNTTSSNSFPPVHQVYLSTRLTRAEWRIKQVQGSILTSSFLQHPLIGTSSSHLPFVHHSTSFRFRCQPFGSSNLGPSSINSPFVSC
jgi:hypothetical protein